MNMKINQETKDIILLLVFIALLFILCCPGSGCTASWHMQRAIKKDPFIIHHDTVRRIDTVWMTVESVDTVFRYQFDTVTYYQDSVRVVYYYNTRDSLVYIEVDCPDCPEITRTETITETIVIEKKSKWLRWVKWIGLAFGVLLVVAIILRIFFP